VESIFAQFFIFPSASEGSILAMPVSL